MTEPWPKLVDRLRRDHNGIMSIELHFGHDGDNTCRFRDYDKLLVEFSCDDMQKSVERCFHDWWFAKHVDAPDLGFST